jgi:hypothetical protein
MLKSLRALMTPMLPGMALARLTEAQAEKDTGMSADEWMRHHDRGLRQRAGSAGHPGLGRVIREPFDFDLDTVFEYGLQRLLDSIDARRHALGSSTALCRQ